VISRESHTREEEGSDPGLAPPDQRPNAAHDNLKADLKGRVDSLWSVVLRGESATAARESYGNNNFIC